MFLNHFVRETIECRGAIFLPMKTSAKGLDLIKSFEGLELKTYVDAVGILTIGYGHTGSDVYIGQTITEQQATELLQNDVKWAEESIEKLITIPLNQNQFDALVSFVFNVGSGALQESTLRRRLNAKEDPCSVAKQELPKWVRGNDGPLLGLVRRRSAEADLFCLAISDPVKDNKTIDITATCNTVLKKEPVDSAKLPADKKARINQSRTIRNIKVLDHKNKHSLLDLGSLGIWWAYDQHWIGLTPEKKAYSIKDDLKYIANFPYFWQQDNGPEGWRQCQTSSIAMCLKYFKVPGINDDTDYLKIVNKYGDTTTRDAHYKALEELKVPAKFKTTLDSQDVKELIEKGIPVPVGILHKGTVDHPIGGGHFIVITGYGDSYWLVQDPYGDLGLVSGQWEDQSPEAGKNKHYSFRNLDPRLFVGGGASGWGWVFERKGC